MKNILLLLVLAISSHAYGAQTATLYSNVHQAPLNQVTNLGGINALIETGSFNTLANPGFEHSTFSTGWTAVNTTPAADATNKHSGIRGTALPYTAAIPTFTQSVTTNVSQLTGSPGVAYAWVKTTDPLAQVCAYVDNAATSTNCIVVGSNAGTTWNQYVIPFIFGSTNYGVQVTTTGSSTGTIYVDDAGAGPVPFSFLASVSQAQLAGYAYFAATASATCTRTSTTSGAFTCNAALPAPTIPYSSVGSWQTTDADALRVTVNSLPPGTYKATFWIKAATTGNIQTALSIFDGTTNCEESGGPNSGSEFGTTVSCVFNYTSTANRSFELYGRSASTSLDIDNVTGTGFAYNSKFILEYYPQKSNIIQGRCDDQRNCTDMFSAFVTDGASTTTVSNENLDWVNGNCTNASAGTYVCTYNTGIFTVAPNCTVAASGSARAPRVDATSTAVTVILDAVAADSNFQIMCQKAGVDFVNSKINYIIGSFSNLLRVVGVTKPQAFDYTFGGTGSESAPTTCAATPCIEYGDPLGTISAPTRASAGVYQVVIPAATFANSSRFKCDCTAFAGSGTALNCIVYNNGNQTLLASASGGVTVGINSATALGVSTDGYIALACRGIAP